MATTFIMKETEAHNRRGASDQNLPERTRISQTQPEMLSIIRDNVSL